MSAVFGAGRLPHAILLQGIDGLGKVAFAESLASLALGIGEEGGEHARSHPDFLHVTPLEGKSAIGIDQIRDLASHLGLTSHQGGYKVALISPAHTMTLSAANSLLKTLEEPSGKTLLILSTAFPSRLPATVRSRCQRLRFSAPSRASAISWLEALESREDWPALLALAYGAPLRACQLAHSDFSRLEQTFRRELGELVAGNADPVGIAAQWAKLDPRLSLGWLSAVVVELIRRHSGVPAARVVGQQIPISHKNIELCSLFHYLDDIYAVIARLDSPVNLQLALEALLIPWAQGLKISNPVTQLNAISR